MNDALINALRLTPSTVTDQLPDPTLLTAAADEIERLNGLLTVETARANQAEVDRDTAQQEVIAVTARLDEANAELDRVLAKIRREDRR